jgi:hypothetical protein
MFEEIAVVTPAKFMGTEIIPGMVKPCSQNRWVDEVPEACRVLAEWLLEASGQVPRDELVNLVKGSNKCQVVWLTNQKYYSGRESRESDTVSEHVHMMAVQLLQVGDGERRTALPLTTTFSVQLELSAETWFLYAIS